MSLIEQLGGYDAVKQIWIDGGSLKGTQLEFELLEHRRANNIFEIGDKVKHDMSAPGEIFTIMDFNGFDFLLNDGDWIFIDHLEHCTDAEIAQGFRDE